MLGKLGGRDIGLWAASFLMAALVSGEGLGQSWELARENGVGGGGPVAQEIKADAVPADKAAFRIVVNQDDQPVIRAAEGVPVDIFGDAKTTAEDLTTAVATLMTRERPSNVDAQPLPNPEGASLAVVTGDTRLAPPTAFELLAASQGKPIVTSALDAASVPARSNRATAIHGEPRVLLHPSPPRPSPVEQVQFSPNTGAQPKAILPPRTNEAPASSFLPSPRKPDAPASVQQAVVSPNLGESLKEPLLRAAPAPDNALVEVVEAPSDYSLEVVPGGSKILNLGKDVVDVFVANPDIVDAKPISPTRIIVYGIELGRTDIYGFDQQGEPIFAMDVDVLPDVDAARGAF